MKKSLLFTIAVLLAILSETQAQRTAILKANEAKLTYPLYKGSFEMGVMPVEGVTYPYQHKGTCKIAFDISAPTADSARNTKNSGILEAMRILNLHVAAGIPKEKLDVVVVFHGPAAMSFINDEEYSKRFKVNNPNMPLIQQLKDNGVKFVVCGQTAAFRNFAISVFAPGTMKAYSARTAIADLTQRGYAVYTLSE